MDCKLTIRKSQNLPFAEMIPLSDTTKDTPKAIEDNEEKRLCPSSRAEAGSLLIGVVGASGRVGIMGRPLLVDDEFLAAARKGRALEKRFRFSSPCLKSRCGQWSMGRCGVIDKVIETAPPDTSDRLRPCGIRGSCRWFAQSAAKACASCPEVVTDTLE